MRRHLATALLATAASALVPPRPPTQTLAPRRAQLLGLAPGARRPLERRRLRRAAAEDALEERLLRLLQGVRAERVLLEAADARTAAHDGRAL